MMKATKYKFLKKEFLSWNHKNNNILNLYSQFKTLEENFRRCLLGNFKAQQTREDYLGRIEVKCYYSKWLVTFNTWKLWSLHFELKRGKTVIWCWDIFEFFCFEQKGPDRNEFFYKSLSFVFECEVPNHETT